MVRTTSALTFLATGLAVGLLVLSSASAANADTTIDGPVGLGTAESFGVLAYSTVTNTGPSTINGDVGLSPGTSITGFPPGVVNGTIHPTDATAAQAQVDLTTAYNVAASLTPTATGYGDLVDLTLTPGVYSGGVLSLTGVLTLDGAAESVWVFQAASELDISTGASIVITGGASACNVFWQVGSSATVHGGAAFQGTVMANVSVTAETSATVIGRLLARTGAVTLDTNTITTPVGCAPAGAVSSSPTITSAAPPAARVGDDYSYTVTSSGTPTATYTITSGSLPPGLTLDAATGAITGQPTSEGSYTFTVTAANGTGPDAAVQYVLAVGAAPELLALSGSDVTPALSLGSAILLAGVLLVVYGRRPRRAPATATPATLPTTRRELRLRAGR